LRGEYKVEIKAGLFPHSHHSTLVEIELIVLDRLCPFEIVYSGWIQHRTIEISEDVSCQNVSEDAIVRAVFAVIFIRIILFDLNEIEVLLQFHREYLPKFSHLPLKYS
ncbi:hypothetical protein PENTCL1PPCAC_16726, partial [Pristionchus entomophagus]